MFGNPLIADCADVEPMGTGLPTKRSDDAERARNSQSRDERDRN
jgi:hypothetical protein